jgi:hypothetical protein
MASVCKSSALQSTIHERINALFKARLSEATHINLSQFDIGTRLHKQLYTTELLEAFRVIKHSALGNSLRLSTEVYVRLADGNQYEVSFRSAEYVDPNWTSTYHSKLTYNDPEVDAYVIARKHRIEAINRECSDLKVQVNSAWNQVSSFNQLAKIWPPVIDLLQGTEYIDRLYAKTPPREPKKLKETLGIDTQTLSATLLTAKLKA